MTIVPTTAPCTSLFAPDAARQLQILRKNDQRKLKRLTLTGTASEFYGPSFRSETRTTPKQAVSRTTTTRRRTLKEEK
jgi:hypothetical protein